MERSHPGNSPVDIAEMLEQASILTTRHISDQAALSLTAALALGRLNEEGPIRLTTLAAAEGIAQPSMTQLIQRLERQGLVTRINDPEDGRAALVNITNAGRALMDDRRRDRRDRLAPGRLARGQGGADPGRERGAAYHPPTRPQRHQSRAQPDSENRMINRREFGGLAGMTLAAVSLGGCTSPPAPAPPSAGAHTSFASMKQIDAGLLNIGYAEDGPPDGKPVILLDGWPYDVHSYVDVAPALAAAGYRVIIPFLRGYGTTTFR